MGRPLKRFTAPPRPIGKTTLRRELVSLYWLHAGDRTYCRGGRFEAFARKMQNCGWARILEVGPPASGRPDSAAVSPDDLRRRCVLTDDGAAVARWFTGEGGANG